MPCASIGVNTVSFAVDVSLYFITPPRTYFEAIALYRPYSLFFFFFFFKDNGPLVRIHYNQPFSKLDSVAFFDYLVVESQLYSNIF